MFTTTFQFRKNHCQRQPVDENAQDEDARYAELQQIALDAARHGELATLGPMLEAGLPIELRDAAGNSLLMLACYHGHEETAAFLLERGATPDARNDKGQTPLGGVAFKRFHGIARRLLAARADPLGDQGGGQTALDFARMFGDDELIALFTPNAVADPSDPTKSSDANDY